MTRQEANFEILRIIEYKYSDLVSTFNFLINTYPDQRFGQICCNYVFPDYRDTEVSEETKQFMEDMFHIDMDPFYEESTETLNRLQNV